MQQHNNKIVDNLIALTNAGMFSGNLFTGFARKSWCKSTALFCKLSFSRQRPIQTFKGNDKNLGIKTLLILVFLKAAIGLCNSCDIDFSCIDTYAINARSLFRVAIES